MIQKFFDLKIETNGQKLHNFTTQIEQWIIKHNFKNYKSIIKFKILQK
jgi:hypothetical protein